MTFTRNASGDELSAMRDALWYLIERGSDATGNPVSADGTAAFTTAADTAAVLVACPAGRVLRKLTVHNTGANAMLISVDGGTVWFYHPGNFSQVYDIAGAVDIQAKNATAGANISGCYRSAV